MKMVKGRRGFYHDLTDDVFGRLTVLEKSGSTKDHGPVW